MQRRRARAASDEGIAETTPMLSRHADLFDTGPVLVPDESDELFSTDPVPAVPEQTPLFAVDADPSGTDHSEIGDREDDVADRADRLEG